jgi:REP element-mobilizing transposase RayT
MVACMARKPRVEFPGAFYHVIARGNQRQAIFHNDRDRYYYLDRLEHYRKRYGFIVYAYVLMTNHVHLLVETGATPLSKIMQGLQFTYTRDFNRRYQKVGHLFQGRYTAILCDRDAYLVELVRYLHLNPARIRMPLNPWRYPWSSHRVYMGVRTAVEVETSRVLGQFARQVGRARQGYLKIMAQGLKEGHQAKYYETVDQRFLGGERFIERVDRKTGGSREIEVGQRLVAFAQLLRAIAALYGVDSKLLIHPGRQREGSPARAMLVYLGRQWSRLSGRALSTRLQRDPSMISRLYARYAARRDLAKEARLATQLQISQ